MLRVLLSAMLLDEMIDCTSLPQKDESLVRLPNLTLGIG
jgi:hypothetical protein